MQDQIEVVEASPPRDHNLTTISRHLDTTLDHLKLDEEELMADHHQPEDGAQIMVQARRPGKV